MGGPEDPWIFFYLYSSMERIHGSSDGWKIVKIRHHFYFLYAWKIHGSVLCFTLVIKGSMDLPIIWKNYTNDILTWLWVDRKIHGSFFYLYSSMKRIHGSSDGWKNVKIRHRFYFLYDWKIHGSFYVTEYRKKDHGSSNHDWTRIFEWLICYLGCVVRRTQEKRLKLGTRMRHSSRHLK